jgi:hypothetical protein
MTSKLRPAVDADARECGRIIHAAFKDVDERHAFTPMGLYASLGSR